MSKLARHKLILQLARDQAVPNQEELRLALWHQGVRVTQATLSRDLHQLGLVKAAKGYTLPAGEAPHETGLPPLSRLVREFVADVRQAQNLLVLKTGPGSAQPVAAAIDAQGWSEMVGTIAGDDTVLLVSTNQKTGHRLALRLREMLA
jgi:transcriptional regulator of arginine metabolism